MVKESKHRRNEKKAPMMTLKERRALKQEKRQKKIEQSSHDIDHI